ncbi:MAG: lytic murein transglycosylase [Rhizobiaceae bacterium]
MNVGMTATLAATLLAGLSAAPASAQECGGKFSTWLKGAVAEAAASGVGAKGQKALSRAQPNSKVLRRDRAQGVFTQTFLKFSGRMVSSYRLKNGAANMRKYKRVFDKARADYGVPPEVISAFWALETDFGAVQGDFSTLNALATLAHDCRRPHLFRPQFIALGKLIDEGIVPANVTGAWAGEIGQMQLLPSDYLELGVDGDGDGRVDLKGSSPDAILTSARFLNHLGWRANQPWIEEISVPKNLPWEQTGREIKLPRSQWAAWGVTYRGGKPLKADNAETSVVLPMGRNGPAFLAYPNYNIYLEWNQSFVYTLTAAYLATRLGGAQRYDKRNPDPGLSDAQMKQLQKKLQALGHDVGKIDGILGRGTRAAVRAEQLRLGMPADAWPTPKLLSRL